MAVVPYFKYNKNLDILSVATGPAFAGTTRDGHSRVYPAHMNRIKHAIRDTASQMSSGEWRGVLEGEERSFRMFLDPMNDTYTYRDDAKRPPVERDSVFRLDVYLTNETQPRNIPRGQHGLYEATVEESEAEMSNLPTAQIHIRSHHDGLSHYFDKIVVTMDGTVRDKATGKIVALRPSAVQDMAHDYAQMIPLIRDRLSRLTHLNSRDHETFQQALLKSRKDLRSLASLTIHRSVHFKLDLRDTVSVRPRGSALTWTSGEEWTAEMNELRAIPVTVVADYRRMGEDGSCSSARQGTPR